MATTQELAIGVAVAVVLAVAAYEMYKAYAKKTGEGFTPTFRNGPYVPYTVLNKQIDQIRGYRNDGFHQLPYYRLPTADRYNRSGANIKPEMIAEAERQQWYSAPKKGDLPVTEGFNAETGGNNETAGSAIDYDTYVTDLVIDPRMRDNHRRWQEEMKPWSGNVAMVDDLDVEPYINFQGLRRPQPVAQYNPLQLTEVDTYDLAVNKKFNFQG